MRPSPYGRPTPETPPARAPPQHPADRRRSPRYALRAGGGVESPMSMSYRPITQWERDFEAAVRRASERQKARKARIAVIERRAQDSPEEALRMAAVLRYRARNGRRHLRRYLKSRWGIKVYSRDPTVSYAVFWPERSPQGSQDRLQRAVSI